MFYRLSFESSSFTSIHIWQISRYLQISIAQITHLNMHIIVLIRNREIKIRNKTDVDFILCHFVIWLFSQLHFLFFLKISFNEIEQGVSQHINRKTINSIEKPRRHKFKERDRVVRTLFFFSLKSVSEKGKWNIKYCIGSCFKIGRKIQWHFQFNFD